MSETYGDTTVTTADLALIGAALLDLAATTTLMRHASPDASTGYAVPETIAQWVAWHFARWCGTQEDERDQSRDLLVRLLNDTGWLEQIAAAEQQSERAA